MSAPLQSGDTVRFTKAFLQSLAMESGPDAPTSLGPFARGTAGLIQSVSQALLPLLSAWVEVGGIASSLCLTALLLQPISI